MLYKNRTVFILLVIICLSISINANAENVTYNSSTLSTEKGSEYFHYIMIDDSDWIEGHRVLITWGIEVISFADDVNDFHDIVLSIDQIGSCSSGVIEEVEGTFECQEFANLPDHPDDSSDYLIDIYANAIFREEISFATDPETDDGWNFITQLTIYDVNADATTTSKVTSTVNNDTEKVTETDNGYINYNFYWAIFGLIAIKLKRKID